MTRPKKNPPSKKEIIAPGIARISIGKGITYRTEIWADWNIASGHEIKKYFKGHPLVKGSFEERIASHEQEAKIILKNAELPEYQSDIYYTPDGRSLPANTHPKDSKEMAALLRRHTTTDMFVGGLTELLKSRGYREREDPEWYATYILYLISLIRNHIKEGNAGSSARFSVELGTYVTELNWLKYIHDTGRMGGPKERRNLSYAALTRYLVRNYTEATATELWNIIPDGTEDEFKIGSYKYYRHAGRLYALRKMSGGKWHSVGKPLQFDAFRKRVIQTRKPSAR